MSDGDGRPAADAAPDAAEEPTDQPSGDRSDSAPADGSDAAGGPDSDLEPGSEPEPEPASAATADDSADVDLSAAPAPGDGLVGLDPRVRAVWLVQAAVSATVFGVIVGGAGLVTVGDPRPGVAVGLLVFALGGLHAVFRYRAWRYEVREESLYLERGVLTRVRTVVPYVRIQHVDASRGPVERAVGLATAVVYTAGSRGADVSIPGLTPEGAEALQRRLERLAIAAEGEDAV